MAGAAIGASAALAPAAQAANLEVNTLADGASDGVCDANCTLRDAVTVANVDPASDDITFLAGLTGEITLTSPLQIQQDLSIHGPGAAVLSVSGDSNANNAPDPGLDTRIFDIVPPGSVPPFRRASISGLTLKEAYSAGPTPDGGAIRAQATDLVLADMVFTGNYSEGGGGAVSARNGLIQMSNSRFTDNGAVGAGGGMFATSYEEDGIAITGSSFTNNRAGRAAPADPYGFPRGGGLYARGSGSIDGLVATGNAATETFPAETPKGFGGGVVANGFEGSLEITDATVTGNAAGAYGGGMGVGDGAILIDSKVSDNSSTYGGGLYLEGGGIRTSTISGNEATGSGGGVYVDSSTNATIRSSTISGNEATGSDPYGGRGGGIFVLGSAKYGTEPAGILRVRNTTVAANTAAVDGGGMFGYAEDPLEGPFIELNGALVGNGTAAGSPDDLGEQDPGAFAAGFSLIEAPGAVTPQGDPNGSNVTGADPRLSPLADNGGPTQTMALAPTSPAVDAAQANGQATDQRGQPRTVDAAATNSPLSDGTDIGAFELADTSAPGDDPDTAFAKKPKKKLKLKDGKKTVKVKLKFQGTDNAPPPGPLTFECRIDKGAFDDCKSPLKLKLAKGKHKIQVRAIDADENVDATPAEATIKVKKAKPKK